jgi:8-oxo-dGTP diphosphatase
VSSTPGIRTVLIRAAGGIVWRPSARGPQLALIHRPRRDDWTLPKGKLEPGERWEEAALREVREETGCLARLASFAGTSFYESRRGPKLVLYWHMILAVEGGQWDLSEVDAVAWLSPSEALRRVDRERDRVVLARAASQARALGAATRTRLPRAFAPAPSGGEKPVR